MWGAGPPRVRAVPGGGGHRPHADEGAEPADERDLRAISQDDAQRVLPGGVSQEAVRDARGAPGGPGRLARGVQRGPAAPGPVVLRQDPAADVPGQRAVGQGEAAGGVRARRTNAMHSDTETPAPPTVRSSLGFYTVLPAVQREDRALA